MAPAIDDDSWERMLAELDDNPFEDEADAAAKAQTTTNSKKRKSPELGIDEEVDLKKKRRVPRVKLDEARLLSDKGIPNLRKRAAGLKFKGKGHEFSDVTRLLSFYQQWLDDLFPKAKFLDALAMVEKAGHKTSMHKHRMEWINEYKPKASMEVDDAADEHAEKEPEGTAGTSTAPVFERAAEAAAGRNTTPEMDDIFEEEDIYDATPKRPVDRAEPEEDLDALLAMAETEGSQPAARTGARKQHEASRDQSDEDDLDALIAEAEAEAQASATAGNRSIFGDGKKREAQAVDEDDVDALTAMAEARADEYSEAEAALAEAQQAVA